MMHHLQKKGIKEVFLYWKRHQCTILHDLTLGSPAMSDVSLTVTWIEVLEKPFATAGRRGGGEGGDGRSLVV